jgi:FkbM family methyltransferase
MPETITHSRITFLKKLIRVLLLDYQGRLARTYVKDGMPQVATFAFDHIGQTINLFGRYEAEELALLSQWLKARGALKGACIDAGANIGNHALFFSEFFAKVFAFEPNPATFRLLAINAGLTGNIQCFDFGLSDTDGEAAFQVPKLNVGGARIVPDNAAQDASSSVKRIAVRRLDAVPDIASQDIGLIKIDVEGNELAVLKGAAATIRRCKPIVIFEQQPREFADGRSPCIDFLRASGYAAFHVFERSPQTRSIYLSALARLMLGETIAIRQIDAFRKQFYPMIIATA